jgi:hypothetical protein
MDFRLKRNNAGSDGRGGDQNNRNTGCEELHGKQSAVNPAADG